MLKKWESIRQKSSDRKRNGRKRGKTQFKKWSLTAVIMILITGMVSCQPAVQAEETNLDLYARGAVLMDADSGRVLYGKEEETVLPMASTTKIMTCILALENGSLTDEVEASSHAASCGVRQSMPSCSSFWI